ncbi:MAG: cyanophycinase [Actinomycetota bacterium]|nr:cyanophycinase [Actinomycetota bacterium]
MASGGRARRERCDDAGCHARRRWRGPRRRVAMVPRASRVRRHRHHLRHMHRRIQPVPLPAPHDRFRPDAEDHKRRASFDPFVVGSVSRAEGIFFAGGDQSDYVRIWKDTPVETAVNGVIARGGVVGGISAGLAILGQFLFAAEKNTITSSKALADCFNMKITLEQDMVDIPTLASTITDSHFTDRGRLGRLMTFMARTIRDGWSTDTKGIGVDGFTAALLEPDGTATVIGDANVSFLRMRSDDVTTCERAEPLQTRFIELHVLHDGDTFNVTTWTGDPNPPLLVRAQDGGLIWGTP